ncbi:hypothetical protein FHU41_001219 [Psychromicrobium silvestre]|uniref:Uncharacterized protein n=1 Tax=Psychromicrobium silvestre TaxID=1645614 RepID=A0A7Y9S5N0_9MICC|nr:hypothetical protein [Psychromicrobium silvestre]
MWVVPGVRKELHMVMVCVVMACSFQLMCLFRCFSSSFEPKFQWRSTNRHGGNDDGGRLRRES